MKIQDIVLQAALLQKNTLEQGLTATKMLASTDAKYATIAGRYTTMVNEINAIIEECKSMSD